MSFRKEKHLSLEKSTFKKELGVDFSKYAQVKLDELWKDTLENGMHGLCFSLYEDGQEPGDMITEEQVERRIKIIKPYTKWVRSFSCIEGNEHIPRIAKKHGLKTLVGAWLSNDLDKNEIEIEALIELVNEGYVDIAAVGNEVLYRNELTEEQLLDYMSRVKNALSGIPIGYVDAYYEFTNRPNVTKACDVILANCYPYWEGCPMEDSFGYMQQMFGQAVSAGNGKKVIITETGWPSEGGNFKGSFSSRENAMKYFINTQLWSSNEDIDIFYFSSFDESWKTGDEGDVGAYWGIWDKNEKLKF